MVMAGTVHDSTSGGVGLVEAIGSKIEVRYLLDLMGVSLELLGSYK